MIWPGNRRPPQVVEDVKWPPQISTLPILPAEDEELKDFDSPREEEVDWPQSEIKEKQ
jgi:hypothetical protein